MDRYQRVLELFKQRLLESALADGVMKIILFGSRAKGTEGVHSDLDVLVVVNDGDQVADLVADVAFGLQVEHQVSVEPVMISLDELFPIQSYFVSNAMGYGQEVYSVPDETLKREERRNLLNLAREYLEGAEQATAGRHWRLAVDAAYNAAELAVKSLILKADDDLSGSHGGLIGRFGELFIKTAVYEKSLGRELNRALQRRNEARYRYTSTLREDEAKEAIELARRLIELGEKELVTVERPGGFS